MYEDSKVVNIGDSRFKLLREKRRWDRSDNRCEHKNLTLDDQGQIVRCDTCGETVSAYWALEMLANHFAADAEKLKRAKEEADSAKKIQLHLVAAKKVEEVWRSRTMIPCCPHCGRGILPEDGLGSARMNRQMEIARRNVDPGNRPGRPIPEK